MRKTTTSLAIFCSTVALTVVAACGKRGDPLPPLRPFPAAAQGLTIRQIGDRIELEWRAPVANTDGTTDKLELAEVEIRRRVIDLPALVEAQTKIVEPKSEDEPPLETEPAAIDDAPPTSPESPAAEVPDAPGDELEPSASEADDPDVVDPLASAEPALPAAPPVPVLVIPDFAPESRYVTTLESTEPGETLAYEEAVDPTWIGKRVEYAVVYINRSNRRGPRTTAVQVDPVEALTPPGQPEAEVGDGVVTVRWSSAQPESYFSVFRRRDDAEAYPRTPLNPLATAETELEDHTVPFNTGSCYTVRSVPEPPPPPPEPVSAPEGLLPDGLPPDAVLPDAVLPDAVLPDAVPPDAVPPDVLPDEIADPLPDSIPDADSLPDLALDLEPTIVVPEIPPLKNEAVLRSLPSPEVCVTPVDTFPPPAPSGLVAVRSGADVLLTWTEVERTDVVGYRVYRARDDDGPFEPLSPDIVRVPSFTDDTVESGEYFYAVTAVDDAPVANESARSELSMVTFTP